MKTKKKRIAQEIQSRILTIVIAIFMVVAVVVAVMVGNVSLSAQKNDLEMQSKAASYQLEIFFQEYMTIVEHTRLPPPLSGSEAALPASPPAYVPLRSDCYVYEVHSLLFRHAEDRFPLKFQHSETSRRAVDDLPNPCFCG